MTWSPPDGLLMDRATIQQELGVKRGTAERIMQQLPKVEFDGVRKCFVRRADVYRLIEESTRAA